MHMACAVAEQPTAAAVAGSEQPQQEGHGPSSDNDDVAEVTFLYKLTAGESSVCCMAAAACCLVLSSTWLCHCASEDGGVQFMQCCLNMCAH